MNPHRDTLLAFPPGAVDSAAARSATPTRRAWPRHRDPRPRTAPTLRRVATGALSLLTRRIATRRPRPDPPPMAVAARWSPVFDSAVDPRARVLALAGEMDMAALGPFEVAAASLTVGRPGDVTVDLQALRFIDASGLGALVALSNKLQRSGWRLIVQHPSPRVGRVFAVAGLSTLLSGSPDGARPPQHP